MGVSKERAVLVAAKRKSLTKKAGPVIVTIPYPLLRNTSETFMYVNGELVGYDMRSPLFKERKPAEEV